VETEEDKTIFVTDDTFVREGGILDETDIEIMKSARSGEGIVEIKNAEQWMALAQGLSDAFDYYREQARKLMTQQQAQLVRRLRVDEHCSWRTVARSCSQQNWLWEPWEPASSQPMGMALCERAAQFFGENYRETPWN